MEGTKSTARQERTTETNGDPGTDSNVLLSNKPLHRFVQKEPRSLGTVVLIFGCAELLMGFQLAGQNMASSNGIYIPFWQGALFLACGILSIYTELHPSKKMVTVCLAIYVVSIFGIIISMFYRIPLLIQFNWIKLLGIEAILLTSSFCVSLILIFLTTVARFALKSTHTQVILQQIPLTRSETTSD